MAIYTTKRLAAVMGVTPGTVLDLGRRLCWPHKNNLYGAGITWNVTDEQITEYFELKLRSCLTKEQREQRALDMFGRWDTAFFGKTFPRNVAEIDLGKWRIAYVNETKDEVIDDSPKVAVIKSLDRPAPPCKKDNCENPRLRNSYGNFYAYCRAHHNEMQRAAGRKHRLKKKAQLLAEKINALNCKKELTRNSASV